VNLPEIRDSFISKTQPIREFLDLQQNGTPSESMTSHAVLPVNQSQQSLNVVEQICTNEIFVNAIAQTLSNNKAKNFQSTNHSDGILNIIESRLWRPWLLPNRS